MDPQAKELIDPKGIRVLGARIVGPLNLVDVTVPFAITGVRQSTGPENPPASKDFDYQRLHPLLYSLDVFLPFVNLHQERYWWPNGIGSGECLILMSKLQVRGSLVEYYLWTQIMAGWLLSAILIAGVTGLIHQS